MSLGLAGDAVALVETGIEPLGGGGAAGLIEDAIDQLFIEDLGVLRGSEIPRAFAPYAPAVGHAMGYLSDGGLPAERTVGLGNAGLTEIFLGKDVGSNLAPLRGH